MEFNKKEFMTFCWRMTSLHMISYLTAGLFALLVLNYGEFFSSESMSLIMRPITSPYVSIGPALQIILGFFMSIFLFPFRTIFISQKNGWIYLFLLILGFSVFSPQLPAPGSFEGLIYTTIPLKDHLLSLPESIIYSFLISFMLFMWYKKPNKAWNVFTIIIVCLIFLMSIAGLLSSMGIIKT